MRAIEVLENPFEKKRITHPRDQHYARVIAGAILRNVFYWEHARDENMKNRRIEIFQK